tara:strand:+ start:210 stop:353 length:144 start_codon:yes stop_codon:yes gene_type:complete
MNSENINNPRAVIIPLIVTNFMLKIITPLTFAIFSCPMKIGTNLNTP